MNVAGVLLYELSEANVIWAQFAQPVQDTGLTGVKEGKVLGHLGEKPHIMFNWDKKLQFVKLI